MTITAPQQPPPPAPPVIPPPRTGVWSWFHDRFTWPLLSAAAFSGIAFGVAQIPNLDGCGDQARPVIEAGEAAFLRGSIGAAGDLAAEALTLSPDCGCAHLLAGRVSHFQMLTAQRAGDTALAKTLKLECLHHLTKVGKGHDGEPETVVLMKACLTPA